MKARTLALSAVLSVTFSTATLADDRHDHRKGRDYHSDHQLYYQQDYRNHNDSHSHRADNRCKSRYGYSHRSRHHDDYRYARRDDAYTAVNVVVGALALNKILHHARH